MARAVLQLPLLFCCSSLESLWVLLSANGNPYGTNVEVMLDKVVVDLSHPPYAMSNSKLNVLLMHTEFSYVKINPESFRIG